MRERKTLPFGQFPGKYQTAIKQLELPRPGRRRYSKASIGNTINGFGQYLKTVQDAGFALELSLDGLRAFILSLDARKIRNSTRLNYLSAVQTVAKAVDYSVEERRLILEDCEIYREGMMNEVPRKVRKLAEHPITLKDVAKAAAKWREEARKTNTFNRRRTYFQRSAVLAFLSLAPLRISDVNAIVIGEHVKRRQDGWFLSIDTQKTGYSHDISLHQSLTPYLDDLVLFGEGGPVLPRYSLRVGTPLFSTETGEHLSSRTLAYNFKVATGHGPHIVRTLVHDELARFGSHGAELALILCGQTSPATAKHYEVHAKRFRAQRAQEVLSDIQKRILHSRDEAGRTYRAGDL